MLSELKHYEYKDAADKLGISFAQLSYYIKRREVRAAVATSGCQVKALIHTKNLSQKNQQALKKATDQYLLIKGWEPVICADETLAVPDYLYLNLLGAVICYTDEPPYEFKSVALETFDGRPVVPLDANGWIEHFYLGARDDDGIYSKAVITAEELAKLSPKVLHRSEEKASVAPSEPISKLGHLKVTGRSNPVREAICHFGNLYIQERGENPTTDLLLKYMIEKSKEDPFRAVTYDVKSDKPISIVGTQMTERDFEKRLKRLSQE